MDALWNLARFIVKCPNMPVIGNFEGSNSTHEGITDIFPDLSNFSPGAAQIYTPFMDRWYAMTSLDSVQSYSFEVWYQTREGDSFPVPINPGESWSILVLFRRTNP